jgi:hypothetical protein
MSEREFALTPSLLRDASVGVRHVLTRRAGKKARLIVAGKSIGLLGTEDRSSTGNLAFIIKTMVDK